MSKIYLSLLSTLLLAVVSKTQAAPEQTYYFDTIPQLEITKGELPKSNGVHQRVRNLNWSLTRSLGDGLFPYALGDNGETYYIAMQERSELNVRNSITSNLSNLRIAVSVPKGQTPTGTLYIPKADWMGMEAVQFKIRTATGDQTVTKAQYLQTKIAHYDRIRNLGAAGSAWYRHQAQTARYELNQIDKDKHGTVILNNRVGFRNGRNNDINSTYSLFSGGRAVSENLQLDRQLRIANNPGNKVDQSIEIQSIEGITVAEIDWESRINPDKPVQPDVLAKAIPHDQHVLLLPNFQNLIDLIDHSSEQGTPILRLLEDRPEDAQTQDRYQHQLCLPTDQLARILGPKLIKSVAITGSDPYLRTGSDLAVLFEAIDGDALAVALQIRRQQIALSAKPKPKAESGKVQGIQYQALTTPDRSICSYMARHGKTLIVTNSPVQLRQILETLEGKRPSVASLPEYTWFRQRYEKEKSGQTTFFLLTDATIRRWCGPRWRIGASRRTQAAAILSELQAQQIDKAHKIEAFPEWLGTITQSKIGPQSKTYGNLAFLTPIAELNIDKVTNNERQAYVRFRDRYQNRWRNFFDPIGGTISITDDKLALDVTILPLIEGSEYNELREVVGSQQFSSSAASPTRTPLLQAIFAIDMKTRTMRQAGTFLARTAPRTGTNGLGWIGKWASVQLEDSPFWKDLAESKRKGQDIEDFLENNFHRIPIIAKIDVRNPFKMTAFLAAFRAFLDQTAPGMLAWENRTYKDNAYVRISLSEKTRREMRDSTFRNFALHYRVEPTRLTLALREDLIKQTIDRKLSTSDGEQPPAEASPPKSQWIGKSLSLRLTADALPHIQNLFQDNMAIALQWRSWNNLHALNEWRRHLGIEDALSFHEQHWHTHLICPGGGQYLWNEEFRTYESTVFGHPGHPKNPDILTTSPLANIQEIGLGLTFEDDGLRARTEIIRKP